MPTESWMLDRYEDYRNNLEKKTVLDTLPPAFDGLAALL
jgi:hypothetical protein